MKKILFIHHAASWGGAPINMINIIKSLDDSKFESRVLLLKDSVVAVHLAENNITFKVAESVFYRKYYQCFTYSDAGRIKWYDKLRYIKLSILWLLSRFFFAEKELKNHDFDIVHLNSSFLCDWIAPSKKSGKVICHIQEPFHKGKFDLFYIFFKRQMCKYANQIIAISKDNAERIEIPEKTSVIYNYSDVPQTFPPEDSYGSRKVLYLGGASLPKGFYTLVDALDFLDNNVVIYFGGAYASNKDIKNSFIRVLKWFFLDKKRSSYIAKMRNHPKAIEIGMIKDVDKYLNKVCCLVSPFSRPHFSRPVIEAHLHRKSAIGSDVKGMDEIIDHGKNGIIVPKNNPKLLANAINSLANDSAKAKQMGENGYAVALQKFTPENIKSFQKVYERLIKKF